MGTMDIPKSSADIHPGKPIYNPSGSKSAGGTPVESTGTTPQTGGVRGSVPMARPGATAPTAPGAEGTPVAPRGALPTIRHAYTMKDIAALLTAQNIPNTQNNMRIAMQMLKHGMELNSTTFNKMSGLLEVVGNDLNMQEAILALLPRGIDNPKAVQILGEYFAANPKMASQIMAMQEALANLQGALTGNHSLLSADMVAQLSALLSQFEKVLKDTPENYIFNAKGGTKMVSRSDMMNDLRAMKALLQGVQEQSAAKGQPTAEAHNLVSNFMQASSNMGQVLNSMLAQTLLSQAMARPDMQAANYAYWQIPNSLVNPPQNMEIIVQRDGSEPGSRINPANTRIVLSLETKNLGKLGIDIQIKDKDVKFTFNTQNDTTQKIIAANGAVLRKKVGEKNFKTSSLLVRTNPTLSTIKPYLIPILDLEALLKVDVEA